MRTEAEAQAMEKAREYFRTKSAPTPVAVLRERIAEPLRAVEEFLKPLSAMQTGRATIPGEWTIHEVVDHLVETYRAGLDELTRVHAEVLRTLAAVPTDYATAARAPLVMVVNVKDAQGRTTPLEWVEDLDWKSYAIVSWRLHAIDHLNQARKILAAAGA